MPFTIGGEWVPEKENKPKPKHPVKVIKERRGNAIVTCILNLPYDPKELKDLCSTLKQRFGCGGNFKDEVIELQGDKVAEVKAFLKK